MPMTDSAQVPAAFQDASAYFSAQDWKPLHEWQKELYRNVMKEIHQALIALGPLIAATVSSLRVKEEKEMHTSDIQDSEKQDRMNHSIPHLFPDTDVSLRKEEEPVSIFIDHLGAEIEGSSLDLNSDYEVVSFRINDELEKDCLAHEDSGKLKRMSSPSGKEIRKRKKRNETPGKSHTASARPTLQNSLKDAPFSGHLSSVSFQNPLGDESAHSQSTFTDTLQSDLAHDTLQSDLAHDTLQSDLAHDSLSAKASNRTSGSERSVGNPQFPKECPSMQQNQRASTEGDTSDSLMDERAGNMRADATGSPFACTEWEKFFTHESLLMAHKRTHLGDKPYMCTFCPKQFNRKDYLREHIRTHTEERPHKCANCEKRFIQKSHLNEHLRKMACSKTPKVPTKKLD